jgi:Fe-S-cluster containining protein
VLPELECDGCRLCCQTSQIVLLPHDDVQFYLTKRHPTDSRKRVLSKRANGDCIYLGETGCNMYECRPRLCRQFDCRQYAYLISEEEAEQLKQHGLLMEEVWKKGRMLLEEANAKQGEKLWPERTPETTISNSAKRNSLA